MLFTASSVSDLVDLFKILPTNCNDEFLTSSPIDITESNSKEKFKTKPDIAQTPIP